MERPNWAEHGPIILDAMYARLAINNSGPLVDMIGDIGFEPAKFHFSQVSDYFSTPINDPSPIDTEDLDQRIIAGIEHALIVDRYLEPIARSAVDALETSFEEPEGRPGPNHPFYESFNHAFAFASMRSVRAYVDPTTKESLDEAKNLTIQQLNLSDAFKARTIAWNRRTNGGRR